MGRPEFDDGVPQCIADLRAVVDRLKRLAPSHTKPEAFHLERDDIEKEIRRVADELEAGR